MYYCRVDKNWAYFYQIPFFSNDLFEKFRTLQYSNYNVDIIGQESDHYMFETSQVKSLKIHIPTIRTLRSKSSVQSLFRSRFLSAEFVYIFIFVSKQKPPLDEFGQWSFFANFYQKSLLSAIDSTKFVNSINQAVIIATIKQTQGNLQQSTSLSKISHQFVVEGENHGFDYQLKVS